MTGLVCLWSGAIVDIPAGWFLCDGNNGTPDLRNEFIVGAGDTYAIADAGGAASHDHAFTADGHAHGYGSGTKFKYIPPTGTDVQAPASIVGDTDADNNLPPYYALAYIMFKGQ